MQATENFLRLIWPDAGEKAIVSIANGNVKHYWFKPDEVPQAATKIQDLCNSGVDVYMGLAGFKEKSRQAEGVVALKSLFLDIDCGEGKDYPDQQAGRIALDSFLASTSLPLPLVLSSGYGLHVYWPLEKELDREAWLVLALGLKELCKTHGLNADHKVTADAARILRPVGSQNFKNGMPRRVAALAAGSICITKDLRKTLLQTSTTLFEDLAKKQVSAEHRTTQFDATQWPEANFDDILPRCATIRWAYEYQDEVREPLWYAALGLGNYCKDGEQVGHRLSSNHPAYDRAATERKQRQWRDSVSGPPTCDTFRSCPDSKCAGCPERITTPLQIGQPKNAVPLATLLINDKSYYTDQRVRVTSAGMQVIHLQKSNQDGTTPPPEWIKLADYGIQPLLNLRLIDNNGVPSNYVWMQTHDENYVSLQNFVVPSVSINNSALFAADCARNGVINEHETFTNAFRTFTKVMRTWVRKLTKDQGQVITFRSFGWVGPDGSNKPKDSFMLGAKLYTPTGVSDTPLLPMLESYQNDMVQRGTLEEWTKAMNGYNLPDMEPYMFATWTAFGAPLMGFTNSGNIVFSLYGDTGVGKSSMQKAIISTYGDFNSKILLDMHDSTLNSVNGGMGYLNSLPYCREEFAEKDAEEISTWVLTMTQGRERGRLSSNLNMAHVRTWSTIAITSSNMSIREIVATTRKDNAARLARVWEQPVTLPISQELATKIFSPLRNNFGHAGPLYIKHIAENYDEVKRTVIDTEEKLMRLLRVQGQDRFKASLLAACFTGARIASELGLIHHDLQRGMNYAMRQCRDLKRSAKAEEQSAEQILGRFIQDIQPNTLVVEYDAPGNMSAMVFDSNNNIIRAPSVNTVTSVRYAAKTGNLYVALNVMREWFVANHINLQLTMQELQRLGLVVSMDEKVVLTKATRLADGKQTRCCIFNLQTSAELTEMIK